MNRSAFLATRISLASSAFGVAVALAWTAFISELVKALLPGQSGLVGLFLYAVAITIIAIVVIVWLGRRAEKSGSKSVL